VHKQAEAGAYQQDSTALALFLFEPANWAQLEGEITKRAGNLGEAG